MPDDISAQLRLAEERISELEANVRYYEERADRAERWVYKVWVEIEKKFFGGDAIRPSPSLPAQSVDDPDMMLGEDCFIFRDADRKALAS